MDRDFEIGGRKFKLNKIDAFKQFHIVRRVGPILADLLPALKDAKKFATAEAVESLSEEKKFEMVGEFAAPVMTGLSKLSETDANAVLMGLLASIEVQQPPLMNWAKIVQGDMVMIQDLELPVLIQLAGRAFMFNLSSFFGALPQK